MVGRNITKRTQQGMGIFTDACASHQQWRCIKPDPQNDCPSYPKCSESTANKI
jgi:hypothetical protein